MRAVCFEEQQACLGWPPRAHTGQACNADYVSTPISTRITFFDADLLQNNSFRTRSKPHTMRNNASLHVLRSLPALSLKVKKSETMKYTFKQNVQSGINTRLRTGKLPRMIFQIFISFFEEVEKDRNLDIHTEISCPGSHPKSQSWECSRDSIRHADMRRDTGVLTATSNTCPSTLIRKSNTQL